MNISIIKDKNIFLFFANVFLVIFGYFLAIVTNFQSLSFMKSFKIVVLFISIFALSKVKYLKNLRLFDFNTFLFFSLWIIFTTLWSDEVTESFSKFLIFIPPLFYIILFITYLSTTYGVLNSKKILDKIFMLTYLFPILYFIFFVRNFDSAGIYGISDDSQGFVSNHFGWSASLIVLFYLVQFKNGLNSNKILNYSLFFISFVILVLSSNRAGLLSVLIAFLFYFFYNKKFKVKSLFRNIVIFVALSIFFYQQLITENSALDFMIQKSTMQIEDDSEARFVIASYSFELLQSDVFSLLFGFGFFDNAHIAESGYNFSSYHNSYLDIFFGIGIFGTILFFKLFYHKSSFYILKNIDKYYYMIPLIIIPYFESNATSGQFLFFPWFSYLVFTSIQSKIKNETNHTIL